MNRMRGCVRGRRKPERGRRSMQDKVRIKICGLRTEEDIRYVNHAMPDYAGFILAQGRARSITPEKMKSLAGSLKPDILRTAVFADQDMEYIAQLAQLEFIDVIQLHGHESQEQILALKSCTKKPVVKAFSIRGPEDVLRAQESFADMILLDHGKGGSGEKFDWSLLRKIDRPFFLAGGLSAENVQEAIRLTDPFAVDVSSSVETDGKKDPAKISAFAQAVRDAGAGGQTEEERGGLNNGR